MAPRFKRKRQSSQTSSNVRGSQNQCSQRVSFRQASLTPQPVPQRTQVHSSHSHPHLHHQTPRTSAASQVQDGHTHEQDELDENLEQVVMAIDMQQKGTIGCAYYIAREEKLYCLQDMASASLDAIETCLPPQGSLRDPVHADQNVSVKVDIQPTLLLLSPRVNMNHSEHDGARRLRRTSVVDEVREELPLPYQLDVRPSQEFSYEAAKIKLAHLDLTVASTDGTSFLVPGDASTYEDEQDHENFGCTNRQGRLLRLSSRIDLENRVAIGCMGAVITHLQRRRAADYLPDDPDAQWAFRVRSLEMFTLRNTMFINPDTLLSLQITQPESHPNAFNQGPGSTGSKESLSIYGLFHHYARTPQGKVRLRQNFFRPSLDLNKINTRLDFVGVFVRPENLMTLQKLSKSMSKVKNIRTVMTHLHKGVKGGDPRFGGFKSGAWATLLAFAYHTIDIQSTLREVLGAEVLPLVAKALDTLDIRSLRNVGTCIHDTVDLDSSVEQNRTVVKRGVNDQLDLIRNVYDGMDDLLSRTALDIARTLPDHVAVKLNVIYFPQLGYHITVPLDPATGQPVYEGDPDDAAGGGLWERMFTTENQAYLKDARMREMDETLGDLWNMICDLEIEISYALAQRVLQHEDMLVAVSDICGELDCMFALALGANQHKLVRPRLTEENIIDIKDCRHLLQEMTVPSYVTNDAYLVGGQGQPSGHHRHEPSSPTPPSGPNDSTPSPIPLRADDASPAPTMLLLTGPNYSGKSIYVKSIALAVYLAHIGSFVPCASAVIGLTDALLTRIRTCETVSRPYSAFMIDLQQVAGLLKVASRRSLIVVDEFGKGTDGCDGAGLLAGVLRHLLGRGGDGDGDGNGGEDAPKVLAATHFHEIFESGLPGGLREGQAKGVQFQHMKVRVDERRGATTTVTASDGGSSYAADDGAAGSGAGTEVTYLYNLRPGRSTESFGTQCAAMNGVPALIVERARQLAGLAARGEDLVGVCAGVGRGEEEDLVEAEVVARRFLQWDLEGMEEGEDVRAVLEGLVGEGGGEGGWEDGREWESGTRTRTRTRSESSS